MGRRSRSVSQLDCAAGQDQVVTLRQGQRGGRAAHRHGGHGSWNRACLPAAAPCSMLGTGHFIPRPCQSPLQSPPSNLRMQSTHGRLAVGGDARLPSPCPTCPTSPRSPARLPPAAAISSGSPTARPPGSAAGRRRRRRACTACDASDSAPLPGACFVLAVLIVCHWRAVPGAESTAAAMNETAPQAACATAPGAGDPPCMRSPQQINRPPPSPQSAHALLCGPPTSTSGKRALALRPAETERATRPGSPPPCLQRSALPNSPRAPLDADLHRLFAARLQSSSAGPIRPAGAMLRLVCLATLLLVVAGDVVINSKVSVSGRASKQQVDTVAGATRNERRSHQP